MNKGEFPKLQFIGFIIGIPCICLDIPISITTDIICLPYDTYDYIDKKHSMLCLEKILSDKNFVKRPYSSYKRYISYVTLSFLRGKLNKTSFDLPYLTNYSRLLLLCKQNRKGKDDLYYVIVNSSEDILKKQSINLDILENLFKTLKKPWKTGYGKILYFFKEGHVEEIILTIYNHPSATKSLRNDILDYFNSREQYVSYSSRDAIKKYEAEIKKHPNREGSIYNYKRYRGPAQHPSLKTDDLLNMAKKYNNPRLLADILENPRVTPEIVEVIYRKLKQSTEDQIQNQVPALQR
jgi:hypothetical protein